MQKKTMAAPRIPSERHCPWFPVRIYEKKINRVFFFILTIEDNNMQ